MAKEPDWSGRYDAAKDGFTGEDRLGTMPHADPALPAPAH